jgi:hypothetical protein
MLLDARAERTASDSREPHVPASYAAIFVSARAVAAACETAVLPLRVGTATIAD